MNDDSFRHRVVRPAVRRTKMLMVAAGAYPKYLQAQMGHSSIGVTLDEPSTATSFRTRIGAFSMPSTRSRHHPTPFGKRP